MVRCDVLQDGLSADSRALLRNADPTKKQNDELFFVDKQGVGVRKGRKEPWTLKSAQILSANEKIPVVPKNKNPQKKWHTETGKIERMQTQLKESGVIADLARKKARRAAPSPAAAERSFDLWGEEEEDESVAKVVAPGAGLCSINPKASNGWPTVYRNNPLEISNAVETLDPERYLSGRRRKHRETKMKPVPSKVKPVEVAHAGASYRPHPKAHQDLMERAATMIVQEEDKVKASRARLGLKEGQRLKRTNLARDGDNPGEDDLSQEEEEEWEEEEEEEGEVRRVSAHRAGGNAGSSDEEGGDWDGGVGGGPGSGGGQLKGAGKLTRTQRNKQVSV